MGSPPPEGSKNLVLIFRSVNNIVIAPANTGRDKTNKKVVTTTLQINKEVFTKDIFLLRILKIVDKKLIDPKIEEAPAKCNEKIAKSTAAPLCPTYLERGG
jgi:hypothetical protein